MLIFIMCCLFSVVGMATDILRTRIPVLTTGPINSANLTDINPSISVQIHATHTDTTTTVTTTPDPLPVPSMTELAIPDGHMAPMEGILELALFQGCETMFGFVKRRLLLTDYSKELLGLGCKGVHVIYKEIRHGHEIQRLRDVNARQDREIRALKARVDHMRRECN